MDPDKHFRRWDWIEYDWRKPTNDLRPESRHVQEDTIQVHGQIKRSERASFLNPLVVGSTKDAAVNGQTLCILRPLESRFTWRPKPDSELVAERAAYSSVCRQSSLFDKKTPRPIEPCPYKFHFRFEDERGDSHRVTCDDWETAAMFFRFRRRDGEEEALKQMGTVFNDRYPTDGMVFAMGTHSRRPEQWLLVGVIRLDLLKQEQLF